MNNLKSLAKKFNLYTVDDMPTEYKELFKNVSNYKLNKYVIPTELLTYPDIEVGIFFECLTQDAGTEREYKYIDHNYILIKHVKSDIIMMLVQAYKTKKYYLHPYYNYSYN